MIRHFSRNTAGRDFIVGDIHGCFSRLQARLDHIGFDPKCDRLFSVGDLVDRGPESNSALEWLEKPWFHAVAGNHEDMAIRWPNGHMQASHYTANGGGWNVRNTPEVQRQISEAFANLPVAIELETAGGIVGIVHADCPFPSWQHFSNALQDPDLSKGARGSVIDKAQWSRKRITEMDRTGVEGVRAVVVGHTPLKQPVILGNVYHIDTGAVFQGHDFTILDAETLQPVPLAGRSVDWAA